MPARFCSQCGTKALPTAKFCGECGTAVGGASADGGWHITVAGSAVLLGFLGAGLAVWTAILTPDGPRPLAAGPKGPPSAARPAGEGQAARKMELPAEVKTFMTDLATKAKQAPDDVETWMKLAQVEARAAQLDPSYQGEAIAAFEHVLAIDPKHLEALRGLANVHYDRDDHQKAIPIYERYLGLRPDDASARTDLGTMYLYAGQAERAIATYQDVIKQNPSFLQAHYNLAVTYHGQGQEGPALSELEIARGLAADDPVRKQIDDMIASLKGEAPRAAAPADGSRSPFQDAVEAALRASPIMGGRIVRFEWSAPGKGRVLVRNFPMEGMPDDVRQKFTDRLSQQVRGAQGTHPVEGAVQVEIADAESGKIMATVTP